MSSLGSIFGIETSQNSTNTVQKYNTSTVNNSLTTQTTSTTSTSTYKTTTTNQTKPKNFTVTEVQGAASKVRTYVEINHKLPTYVQISTYKINMNQFLELLTSSLLQINLGTNKVMILKNFTAPTSPQDNIKTGNIYKSEYLHIAQDIKNYMDSSGKTPDFAYQTSLGTLLGYDNLVYMYSMIMDYHSTSGKMADFAIMKPWSAVKSSVSPILGNPNIAPTLLTNAPVGKTFNIEQIKGASSRLRTYIEANHKLPCYIQLSTYKVATNQFLEMLTSALLQIKLGTNNPIPVRSFTAPVNPQDNIQEGNIYKSEYLKIAQDVKNYMDSSGKTPDFAYQTSLGTQLGFQNLVYMFSMILDYNRISGKLADYAAMKPWDPNKSYPYSAGCRFQDPTLDAIMRSAAGYGYSGAHSTAAELVRYGAGDCWAFSELLNSKLRTAGYQSRIVQYATAYSSCHRSVDVFLNNSWFRLPYRAYGYTYLIV